MLTAISVAISTRLPMLANLVVCILVFFLGHLSPVLVEVSGQTQVNELVGFMARFFAWVLPSLEFFNAGPSISTGAVDSVAWVCFACIGLLHVVQWSSVVVRVSLLRGPGPGLKKGIARMQAEGYRRARKLLTSRGDYIAARILGFVQSLLLVALLGILAIFVAVLASRGEARVPSNLVSKLPSWVISRASGEDARDMLFKDTGVFPLIARNLFAGDVFDRLEARRSCC